METYGVDIGKFLVTDAGIVYLDIRDRILPYLRAQHENAELAGVNIRSKLKIFEEIRSRLDNVEMKFKKKVCKDIIKFLPNAIVRGKAFLDLYGHGKFDFGKNTEFILARAEEVVEAAENRLKVYREARNFAEKFGMPAAFEQWKRGLEISRQLAEQPH